VLHGARLAYETYGRLNAAGDNAILILAGLSADAHAASHPDDPSPGWWEEMLGPGRPIDTSRWYVLCVNSLGSCMGSTGPASMDPRTGSRYGLSFPDLSIEDIADAAADTVRALGVRRLACVIGTSMGGMSSLALLSRHPSIARAHISISSGVHSLPFAIAMRSLQREAICSDPNWNMGLYDDECAPRQGMLLARKLGFITYRSPQEWNDRFGWAALEPALRTPDHPFKPEFALEGYLHSQALRFSRTFDPNCYLYLSRCIDRFDLGELADGSPERALARLSVDRALVIGASSDILFPLPQQQQIADGLRAGGADVQFLPVDSLAGHDAFLVEPQRFGPPVAQFLSSLASRRQRELVSVSDWN
jgi:homoserine O-acetyltransferase/serine/homoserine O-acetyltransferase